MAEPIAALPRALQIALMTQAARVTAKRSVRGQTSNRFYAHECGLSPSVVKAMRDEGHGEEIFSGRGYNSRRIYFPIEILENASQAISSNHVRLNLRAAPSGFLAAIQTRLNEKTDIS